MFYILGKNKEDVTSRYVSNILSNVQRVVLKGIRTLSRSHSKHSASELNSGNRMHRIAGSGAVM